MFGFHSIVKLHQTELLFFIKKREQKFSKVEWFNSFNRLHMKCSRQYDRRDVMARIIHSKRKKNPAFSLLLLLAGNCPDNFATEKVKINWKLFSGISFKVNFCFPWRGFHFDISVNKANRLNELYYSFLFLHSVFQTIQEKAVKCCLLI